METITEIKPEKKGIPWFFRNLVRSLFNDKDGFSVRKCIAVIMVKVSIVLEIACTSTTNVTTVLMLNFAFIALLLGLVTAQNLIELKNGKS